MEHTIGHTGRPSLSGQPSSLATPSQLLRRRILKPYPRFTCPPLRSCTFCFPSVRLSEPPAPPHPSASSRRLALYLARSRGTTAGELLKARCPSERSRGALLCAGEELCAALLRSAELLASGCPIPLVRVCLVILHCGGDRGGRLPVRLLRL